MALDIRADVQCSLGTLINGSLADNYLQANGLIRTRGEVVLDGTQTPAVGTQVTFTYTKNGSTYTLPRVLRVLSSFADPFRRTTTVQLGCKLTYLENRKPPVENPNSRDENSDVPCSVYLQATLPISAQYVFEQCLTALDLTSAPVPLTSKFSVEEFDLTPGYIQVMSDLLQSEGYIGYLDSTETLQFIQLTEAAGAGPVLTAADVIDLGPIGSGDLPGESVVVRWDNLRLLAPEDLYGDDYLMRSWEVEEVFGAPVEVSVSYVDDEGDTITASDIFYPYSFTATRYDVWDRKIESVSLNQTSSAEVNNRWASDAFKKGGVNWNAATNRVTVETVEYELYAAPANTIDLLGIQDLGNSPTAIKQALATSAESHSGPADLCKEQPPDGYDVVKSQTTINYFSELELAGSLNLDSYISDGGVLASFDTTATWVDSKVVVEYDTDTTSGVSKTLTKRWISRSQTVAGQQDLATKVQDLDTGSLSASIDSLLTKAGITVYEGAIVGLHTQRQYGLQQRPSAADRNNTANRKPQISESKADITWITGSTTSTAVTEFTLPYAPDDEISWDATTQTFSSTPSDAPQKALNYGRIQNALLLGHRNGVSLQLTPEQMPPKPFDPLYLEVLGITASYRVNGTSWAFDSNGIVVSADALLWGAVSAEAGTDLGSSWVPLAPGTTSLPAPYTPTGGTPNSETGVTYDAVITPTTVLPPYIESVAIAGVSRSTLVLTEYPYTLDLGQTLQSLPTKTTLSVGSKMLADATAFSVSGQAAGYYHLRKLKGVAGSFATTGYNAGNIRDYAIGTNAGTFTVTEEAALLKHARLPLSAELGSYALSGEDSDSWAGIAFPAACGTFALGGQDASKLQSIIMSSDAGSFNAAGQVADFAITRMPIAAVLTYTGTAATQSITGAGFKPGWALIHRSDSSGSHMIFDKRRGATNYFSYESTAIQTNNSATLTSFDADGFTLGNSAVTNGSGLAWLAILLAEGGAATTDTSGTITTTVNSNDYAGYSIFSYTGNSTSGATVGHGLSTAPDLVLIKNYLSTGAVMNMAAPVIGNNYRIACNSNSIRTSDTASFQSFNSSTLTLGSSSNVNAARSYVGYAFRNTDYVKVGTIAGNNISTITVDLGFRPTILLLKSYLVTTGNHFIYYKLSAGDGFATGLTAHSTTTAPAVSSHVQFLSTGFSVAPGGSGNTGSSAAAVYLAIR